GRRRTDVGSTETATAIPTNASESDHAGTEWRRGAGERVGLAPVAAEDEAELVAATAQLGGRLEENGVPLAPLEGSEDEDHHIVRRESPPPTEALRCPGRRHPRIRVDAARHDADALVPPARLQDRLTPAF